MPDTDLYSQTSSPTKPGRKKDRRRAMVVDPKRSSRAFVAEALNSFEPGFDVVTAADTEQAAQWTFVPDLVVIDVDDPGAVEYVVALLARPESANCRIIWIGGFPADSYTGAVRCHGVLGRDAGLSELLRTIRSVWDC